MTHIWCGRFHFRKLRVIKSTIDRYSGALGQSLNWHKVWIFFFNTNIKKHRDIYKILGMKMGKLPGKYLGIPLFAGVSRTSLWNDFRYNCIKRMEGWRSEWLTLVGMTLMLQYVIFVSQFSLRSILCFLRKYLGLLRK